MGRAHKKCYTTSPTSPVPPTMAQANEKRKRRATRKSRNLYAFWSGSGNDSCGSKGTRECRKYCASDHNNAMKRLARGEVRKTVGKQKTKETHSIFAPFQFPTRANQLIHLLLVTAGRPVESVCPSCPRCPCNVLSDTPARFLLRRVHYLIDKLIVSHCDFTLCAIPGKCVPEQRTTASCLLKSPPTATTHQNNAQQFVSK